jgi:hypothetical protein
MVFNLELGGPALLAVASSIGLGAIGGKMAFQWLFGIKEAHAVIIDVADCNRALEEMVKGAIANGLTDDRAKTLAYYENELDMWLSGQGVSGNARDASITKLAGDAVALEQKIAASLPKPPTT